MLTTLCELAPVPLILSDVGATALATLFCRAAEQRVAAPLLRDPLALQWAEIMGPRFAPDSAPLLAALAAGRIPEQFQLYVALRSRYFDAAVRAFHHRHRRAFTVNLGCGFDTRCQRLAALAPSMIELDRTEIISIRETLPMNAKPGTVLSASATGPGWIDEVADRVRGPVQFIAEGLLMYLPETEVRDLVVRLARRFPGAEFVAEFLNSAWLKQTVPTNINAQLRDELQFGAEARFISGIAGAGELERWVPGTQLLGEWSHLDEVEPRLGNWRKLRHVPGFRRRQWTVRVQFPPT